MKTMLFAVLMVVSVGCASTADLKSVSDQVALVQAKQLELESKIAALQTHVDKCDTHMNSCTEHCSQVDSKLDRVFKKAQQK